MTAWQSVRPLDYGADLYGRHVVHVEPGGTTREGASRDVERRNCGCGSGRVLVAVTGTARPYRDAPGRQGLDTKLGRSSPSGDPLPRFVSIISSQSPSTSDSVSETTTADKIETIGRVPAFRPGSRWPSSVSGP